jgi:hypothetical protein
MARLRCPALRFFRSRQTAILTTLIAFCSSLPAQRVADFTGLSGFQGTVTLRGSAKGTQSGLFGQTDYDLSWQIDGQVKLNSKGVGGVWDGPISGTAVILHKEVTKASDCTRTSVMSSEGAITYSGGQPMISLQTGPGDVYKLQILAQAQGKVTVTLVCPEGTSTQVGPLVPVLWVPTAINDLRQTYPLPAAGLTLARTATEKLFYPFPFSSISTVDVTMSWDLKGAGSPLEVVIEPQNYEKWRPEALFDESTPTSPITVAARLQHEDGSAPTVAEQAARFVFELTKVSHEPGIAMNSPLKNPKSTPDLRFVKEENAKLIISGDEDNIAATLPGSHVTASAVVSSYDWGAWGSIKVTAELPDGRVIEGYLKGDKSQKPVRLPKRSSDSKIADAWKAQVGVDKPDDDDSEADPKGLQDCDGDGLTLYEEYRGFLEDGSHIEGNPKKKDLFIRNDGGSVLEPGIFLFSDLTGLEVHQGVKSDELDFDSRLINGNHGEAPHRVDQHGVVILVCAKQDGGVTVLNRDGVRGRPGLVKEICIQSPDEEGTATKPFNLVASDAIFSYDVAVAHELLHASGVDHHGDSDTRLGFKLVLAADPANKLGKPYYQVNGVPATVLDEKTGEDLAARDAALAGADEENMLRELEQLKNKYDTTGDISSDERTRAGFLFTALEYRYGEKSRYVGQAGGQHSGNDGCVMRYFFAQYYPAYPPSAQPITYYKVPPGSEPLGTLLCERGEGTGVNAPGRNPQSRYSDAITSRGACRWWVCINDAIPAGAR